jgi:N-hydroxyarylamine O-acetyltransferase
MVVKRRGGYCFEHNGLFKAVLCQIGFDVTAYMARVLWFLGPGDPLPPRTHMAMRVAIDGEDWLADVGFGGATMLAPLRMRETAPQQTINGTFRLTRLDEELKLELLSPRRWIPMVQIALQPQLDIDFVAPNWYTSAHPNSTFKKRLMACRSMPEARHTLLNNRYTIRTPDGAAEERVLDRSELDAVLREVFDVTVTDTLRAALERVVWGSC